tara:strand:+ start:11619 stop:12206 length:588 start_codon:yes stop_codon:yes gene_type:complete
MARTAKITNANVAPSRNKAGLVGNTPVRAQDFNDLAGDYISSSDANAQSVASAVTLSSTLTTTGLQTATAGVTASSASTTGFKKGAFLVPCIPDVTFQDLSGAGAANVTAYHTRWTTTGAQALTLAAGTELGQLKKITLVVDGGNGTLTIADPISASLNVVVFGDAGDFIELIWNGTAWRVFAMAGAVDAGPGIS